MPGRVATRLCCSVRRLAKSRVNGSRSTWTWWPDAPALVSSSAWIHARAAPTPRRGSSTAESTCRVPKPARRSTSPYRRRARTSPRRATISGSATGGPSGGTATGGRGVGAGIPSAGPPAGPRPGATAGAPSPGRPPATGTVHVGTASATGASGRRAASSGSSGTAGIGVTRAGTPGGAWRHAARPAHPASAAIARKRPAGRVTRMRWIIAGGGDRPGRVKVPRAGRRCYRCRPCSISTMFI